MISENNIEERWKNFSVKEIINPTFDDNPAKNDWLEMPELIRYRLMTTMDLVQIIRDVHRAPLRINSSWRLSDKKGRAHREGYAIDIQNITPDPEWGHKIINWLQNNQSSTIATFHRRGSRMKGFRVFWEHSHEKQNDGWMHIDTNYDVKYKECKYKVGFIKGKEWCYPDYTGKAPWEYSICK